MLSRDATVKKIDKRIAELWRTQGRTLPYAKPHDRARLWRQIDALLDKRIELRP